MPRAMRLEYLRTVCDDVPLNPASAQRPQQLRTETNVTLKWIAGRLAMGPAVDTADGLRKT